MKTFIFYLSSDGKRFKTQDAAKNVIFYHHHDIPGRPGIKLVLQKITQNNARREGNFCDATYSTAGIIQSVNCNISFSRAGSSHEGIGEVTIQYYIAGVSRYRVSWIQIYTDHTSVNCWITIFHENFPI